MSSALSPGLGASALSGREGFLGLHAAGNAEGSADGGEYSDNHLQDSFPDFLFHFLFSFLFLVVQHLERDRAGVHPCRFPPPFFSG